MPIPQGSADTVEDMNAENYEYYDEDEEWGDDEWEWESEPEEKAPEPLQPSKPPPVKPIATTNNTSQSNGVPTTNGTMVNGNAANGTGSVNNAANGVVNGTHAPAHVINIEDAEVEEAKGKADIKIQGNLLKIERNGPVDWSDDEYEDDDDDEIPAAPPPPPPPPPVPAPPPPPPPAPQIDEARAKKLKKIEDMKRKPTQKPDWNELMKDIDSFRFGKVGKLKKTVCNDRSKPVLSGTKIQGKFIYDSEQKAAESDIFHDIKKGIRLKHVRTNDRSKPMLQGIRCFRRQTTKEDKLKMGTTFEETLIDEEDEKDMDNLMEDLESTKQLLELEVRSKKLLEKDNKRLAQELEKLKMEMLKGVNPVLASDQAASAAETSTGQEELAKVRRNSVALKRHSVIRLLSESESHDNVQAEEPITTTVPAEPIKDEDEDEEDEELEEDEISEPVAKAAAGGNDSFYEEELAEIEEMRDEVEEARKLAEEWEAKYKEMQRQMSDLDGSRYKKHSLIIDNVPMQIQKKAVAAASVSTEFEDADDGDYTWMLKREIHTLVNKLRHVRDKREIVMRERQLIEERIETLIGSISNEVESRKCLRKEINQMNEAFKEEIREMAAEQKTAEELEECYFSDDEDLVVNTHKHDGGNEDDWLNNDPDIDDDAEETLDEIVKAADEPDKEDPGAELFVHYPNSDGEDIDEEDLEEEDYEPTRQMLNKTVEHHNENVQLMRKSNFMLKAKIDLLYDILQQQKEKHHDLRLELTRMLADIQ